MSGRSKLAEQVLDTALMLAERSSWEAIRLHDVATELGITLQQISEHYAQKDDLAEAWFDRADRAMLKDAARPDYLQLTADQRLHRSLMSWLGSMSDHRRVTGQMLLYKFEIGHIHLQALGIMRISRTVQWMLEAAHRDAVNIGRVLEEIAVTSIYLCGFAYWLSDESSDAVRTANFIDKLLRGAGNVACLIPGSRADHVRHEVTRCEQARQNESVTDVLDKVSRL